MLRTATSDFDEDGLDNATEIGLGTRYTLADTDGDSLSDGDEVNTHGTNPLSVDSDMNSLSDPEELAHPRDRPQPCRYRRRWLR